MPRPDARNSSATNLDPRGIVKVPCAHQCAPTAPEMRALSSGGIPGRLCEEALRILQVNGALALRELHLALLRSIPAIVETLISCADKYLHEEQAYPIDNSEARTGSSGTLVFRTMYRVRSAARGIFATDQRGGESAEAGACSHPCLSNQVVE
jgi:hypothetical protein